MNSRDNLDAIPDQYLQTIAHYLMGLRNDTIDLSKPQLRPSFNNNYQLFIFLYVFMIFFGTITNISMIYHITKHRLYSDPTCAYLINIAISDLTKCIFVLPLTLAVLLVQNWIFGKFLCFFLPMLQDIPLHVSMMTYLLIAGDRYRLVSDPGKPRIPAFVCALGAWFFAVCIVLPYAIYTTYLDLGTYKKPHFEGLGICLANLTDDIQQYMRALFLLTYIAPLTITAYLYVKASRELQNQEEPPAVAMFEARRKHSYARHGSNDTSNDVTIIRDGKRESNSVLTSGTAGLSAFSTTYDLYDAELDVRKEKRTQKYLIFMVSVFAILLCPLMVLRLAKPALVETYENTGHFDITFTMFVWLAFASTVTTPALYASWQMSRVTKERLKGYFKFSTNQLPPVLGKGLRQHRHQGGLANVAYTPHPRGGSLSGSNGGEDYTPENTSFQSPDLGSSGHRINLV